MPDQETTPQFCLSMLAVQGWAGHCRLRRALSHTIIATRHASSGGTGHLHHLPPRPLVGETLSHRDQERKARRYPLNGRDYRGTRREVKRCRIRASQLGRPRLGDPQLVIARKARPPEWQRRHALAI